MHCKTPVFLRAVIIAFVLICSAANAEEVDVSITSEQLARENVTGNLPLWEAGVFSAGFTQPAYPGAEDRVALLLGLPFVVYRGDYLRIDRGTVGVRAVKTPRTEIDVGFSASLGSRASDIEVRRGMEDLGTLIEFGPRLKINLGDVNEGERNSRIQIPLRGVFDLNDHFRFRGVASEIQWVRDMNLSNGWFFSSTIGAIFGEQQLMDTYYRVAPGEAASTRPVFDAKGGLIAFRTSLFASHLINNDVRFFSYFRLESLEGASNKNSPLVLRDSGWSFGFGFAWTLAQSDRIAKD